MNHTIILSPNAKKLFSANHLKELEKLSKVTLINTPTSLEKIPALKEPGAKVIALDPDFCHWQVSDKLITNTRELKAICLQTTSFSWINIKLAALHHIPVTNLRGFSAKAVAEEAVLITYLLARRIPLVMQSGWQLDYQSHLGTELQGKTVGIVGLGRIGSEIADLCHGQFMHVQYWSKHTTNSRYTKVSLNQLFKTSDIIYTCLALNPQTNKLITDTMLHSMKSNALLVNVATDGLYDHALALKLAGSKKIAGYGFESDDPKEMISLQGNIWAGPALGWVTHNSLKRNADAWFDSITHALKGSFPTQVN